MIRYPKRFWGLSTLARLYGSAIPRALPFSLLAALQATLLRYFFGEEMMEQWKHPYPFQTFAFVAGFIIVFRSNLGYQRYWEGRTQLQAMTAKLTDAVVLALTFDRQAVTDKSTKEEIDAHLRFCDTFVHLISLLHAIALATLREDFNMANIIVHDSLSAAPGNNVNSIAELAESEAGTDPGSDPDKAERRTTEELLRKAGSRKPGKAHRSFHGSAGRSSFLDYFILRTDVSHALDIYERMPLSVIGGLTQAEGNTLGGMATIGNNPDLVEDLNHAIHGITLPTGQYLPAPTERVHTVLAWVLQLIHERRRAGGVKAEPPIVARIHAVLSDTMLGYEQCRKLVDTQFPFPWAQAISFVLLLFTFSAPFVISAFCQTAAMAGCITFLAVHTYIMLNEVARDIEDPFHYDPNELPLPQIQYKLNERLLAAAKTTRPPSFLDIPGGTLSGPGNRPSIPPAGPKGDNKVPGLPIQMNFPTSARTEGGADGLARVSHTSADVIPFNPNSGDPIAKAHALQWASKTKAGRKALATPTGKSKFAGAVNKAMAAKKQESNGQAAEAAGVAESAVPGAEEVGVDVDSGDLVPLPPQFAPAATE